MPTCLNCNCEFSGKRSDAIYCSEKCEKQQAHIRRKAKREQQRDIQPKVCPICNIEFTPHKNVYKKQKYCSEKCKLEGFYRRRAEKGRTEEHRKHYLKNKDKLIQKQRERRYNNNYSGNGLRALERDNFKCVVCNSVANGDKELHIHHKDFSGQTDSPNDNLDNLITLCMKCHSKIHFNEYMKTHNPTNYKEIPKEQIEEALATTTTVQAAADKLGITRKTLLLKRKQYGLPLTR